jgi:hypothetical protein
VRTSHGLRAAEDVHLGDGADEGRYSDRFEEGLLDVERVGFVPMESRFPGN